MMEPTFACDDYKFKLCLRSIIFLYGFELKSIVYKMFTYLWIKLIKALSFVFHLSIKNIPYTY